MYSTIHNACDAEHGRWNEVTHIFQGEDQNGQDPGWVQLLSFRDRIFSAANRLQRSGAYGASNLGYSTTSDPTVYQTAYSTDACSVDQAYCTQSTKYSIYFPEPTPRSSIDETADDTAEPTDMSMQALLVILHWHYSIQDKREFTWGVLKYIWIDSGSARCQIWELSVC